MVSKQYLITIIAVIVVVLIIYLYPSRLLTYDPFIDSIILIILYAFVIFYISAYIIFVRNFIIRKSNSRESKKHKFFTTLERGLENGWIETPNDILNIYKGIYFDLDEYNLSTLLREFLVELLSKNKFSNKNNGYTWKQKLTEFIQKFEAIAPYAGLPPTERNLLNDILTFIEKNDIESAKKKLIELAGMIQARHEDLNRISTMNKWALILSGVGLILTIASLFIRFNIPKIPH